MAVNTLTLYLAGQQVQVVEGSQLHLIYASMGATASPPVPGPVVRPDPFPQYVHDDEIGDLLADAVGPTTVFRSISSPGKSMFEGATMLNLLGVPGSITIGYDPERGPTRWALDPATGRFYADYDAGVGFPLQGPTSGRAMSNLVQIVRFGSGSYLTVLYGANTATAGIYQSDSFGFSPGWTKVHDLTTDGTTEGSAGPIGTGIAVNADRTVTLVGEYGVPRSGGSPSPKIWRSAWDEAHNYGVVWDLVYTGTERHVHAVEFDPYNPTHVYATTGDGDATAKLLKSTDSGATWSTVGTVSGNSRWQAVQISFSPNFIWLAADSDSISAVVVDRATMTPKLAAKNSHMQIAVPGGAPGDLFHSQTFWGAYDDDTDKYYFVTADAGSYGNRHGAFYIDKPGGQVHLLAPLPDSFISQRVYFTGSGATRQMFAGNARFDIGAATVADESVA